MNNYKTIDEMTTEWSITQRHIQNLCRNGKITGSIKRAGAWFIPDDALNPAKNTKSDDKPFRFIGTKKTIFNNSVRLFTEKGYENVSINDIAASTGIRQSAVYNHFRSKQEILETIYEYFKYYASSNRPGVADVQELLMTGSLTDIITKGFIYSFEDEVRPLMVDISKLIMQRVTTDERASHIFQAMLLEDGINFVEKYLDIAVDMGRIAPLDTHAMSLLINGIRLQTFVFTLLNSPRETVLRQLEYEKILYGYAAALITDLRQE